MSDHTHVKRNHKDTMFHDLFSNRRHALSLYNALNGTDYRDADALEIVTLSDAVYIHGKNDVSVLFHNMLELWEHQSTLNCNMPLRGLIYYAHNIDGILKSKGVGLYGKKIVKIPAPDYYVFYNGRSRAPDRQELKLSDAFETPKEGYEWTAHMLNINSGHNAELLQNCPALKGYVMLVHYIREYQAQGADLSEAVSRGIDRCIRENLLKEYLLKNKSEVKLMLLTEFDEDLFIRTVKEEGREEGLEEGLREGLKKGRNEGFEKGRNEGFKKGRNEGFKKGRNEGEDRVSRLYQRLMEEKKMTELERAASDRTFREMLYKKYGI